MTTNEFVRARIDGAVKAEAEAVLNYFGLTVSDAVRMTLTHIAREKELPFELKIPNRETQKAMAEARALVMKRHTGFQSGQDLIDTLDEKKS